MLIVTYEIDLVFYGNEGTEERVVRLSWDQAQLASVWKGPDTTMCLHSIDVIALTRDQCAPSGRRWPRWPGAVTMSPASSGEFLAIWPHNL